MKNYIIILILGIFIQPGYSQEDPPNEAANPFSQGINAMKSPIQIGERTTVFMDMGNNGADPIPAGGATWNIFFPPFVTVDQSSLDLDGAEELLAATWVVTSSGTELAITSAGEGLPGAVLFGPQFQFTWTVDIVGAVVGGPTQQTMDNVNDPAISGNIFPDDSVFGPIEVVMALPVTLISFEAEKEGLDGVLEWVTASEINNDRFEIERSIGGGAFKVIGKVKGNGTTYAKQSYSFTDKGVGVIASGQKVYYRLHQYDYDGSSEYSPVADIRFGRGEGGISVFPNPMRNSIQIGLGGYENVEGAEVVIYDASGKEVKRSAYEAGVSVDTESLSTGSYMIRIVQDGETLGVEQVVKTIQ